MKTLQEKSVYALQHDSAVLQKGQITRADSVLFLLGFFFSPFFIFLSSSSSSSPHCFKSSAHTEQGQEIKCQGFRVAWFEQTPELISEGGFSARWKPLRWNVSLMRLTRAVHDEDLNYEAGRVKKQKPGAFRARPFLQQMPGNRNCLCDDASQFLLLSHETLSPGRLVSMCGPWRAAATRWM